MPFGAETYVRSRFLMPVAGAALALALSIGLAGCGGGGGSGVGGEVMIMPGPSGPDLVVESPSVSDADPAAGGRFTLSVSVRNAGGRSAAATTLRFYRSEDTAITPSDEEVDSADVAELAASASFDTEVGLTAPSPPGTYYYGACVAAVSGESDVANNCSSSVRVAAPAPRTPAPAPQPRTLPPDLVVESLSASDDAPATGGFFWLHATLRIVEGTSERAWLSVYRSDNAAFTTSSLQVKKNWKLYFNSRSMPSHKIRLLSKAPTIEGDYYYRMCANAAPGESAMTNKCSAAVKIEVSHDKPNLLITGRSRPPGVYSGQRFTVTAIVTNTGGESEATTLRFLLLPDRTSPPSSGTIMAEVAVPSLVSQPEDDAPAYFHGWTFLTAPSALGKFYYVACVDAVPGESRTTDNCSGVYRTEVVQR